MAKYNLTPVDLYNNNLPPKYQKSQPQPNHSGSCNVILHCSGTSSADGMPAFNNFAGGIKGI